MATREHYVSEIEAIQRKKALLETEQEQKNDDEAEAEPTGRVKLVGESGFDQEIYGGTKSKFAGYVTSIAPNEQVWLTVFIVWWWNENY